MEFDLQHTCCFFGHRNIDSDPIWREKLSLLAEKLIEEEKMDTFLFGSRSEFNTLCREVITGKKKDHPHIRRIYVRAEYLEINDSYRNKLLLQYEDTYFPSHIRLAGKSSYVERNYEMVNHSRICVVWYSPEYVPCRRRESRRILFDRPPKSGTKIAYEYALKKNKQIINLMDL